MVLNTLSSTTTSLANDTSYRMLLLNGTSCPNEFRFVSAPTPYLVNAVLNAVLSIVTVLGNALVFSAIRNSSGLHMPSKIGLCNLVLTDLGVGLISQPLFVTYLTAKATGFSQSVFCVSFGFFLLVASCLTCVSLLTITVISVDRYIAFHYHVSYHEIVTVKRAIFLIACVWLVAGLVSVTVFLWRERAYFPAVIAVLSACLLTTTFFYLKTVLGLYQHTNRVCADQNAERRRAAPKIFDVTRHRKGLWSMIWISFLFLLCYVPSLLIGVAVQVAGRNVTLNCAFEYTITIAFFNSCLNPFLYCWRIPLVRESVLQRVRGLCASPPR